MSPRTSRSGLTALLVCFFLTPLLITALTWADVHYWHFVIDFSTDSRPSSRDPEDVPIQSLRQSILRVQIPSCDGNGSSSGTSFVVKEGYVATAAHVIEASQECQSEITLIDHRGVRHTAQVSAYSEENDLAILSFPEEGLVSLFISDSSNYESTGDRVINLMTIGYPPAASTEDQAAISSVGNISSYRNGLFLTSGMDLNPGNSGGPVFLTENWTVLGVAIGGGDSSKGTEGLGVVVPADTLRRFFEERVGSSLPPPQ